MVKQRPRDIIKEQHERSSLDEALDLLNLKNQSDFRIVERPDPPDAIVFDGTIYSWMEHVDAFRTEEEARELLTHVTPGEVSYQRTEQVIVSPDERIANSILCKMRTKLAKTSYKTWFEKYGKGILIITIQDPLFSETSFAAIDDELGSFYGKLRQLIIDQGYFKEVYVKFRLSFWVKSGLKQIYPKLDTLIIPEDAKPENMCLLEKEMNSRWSQIIQQTAPNGTLID